MAVSLLNNLNLFRKFIYSFIQFNKTNSNCILKNIIKFGKNYFQDSNKIDKYIDEFSDELIDSLPFVLDTNAIYLLLFELLNNIFKHSCFRNAYVLCQYKPGSNKINISIFDDGISIPGSLENNGITFNNDSEAIFQAINGTSSDREKYKLKGRGLNTSVNLIVNGFGEDFLIASRKGICTIDKKGVHCQETVKPYIDGTLIVLEINANKFNIYDYTSFKEFEKSNLRSDWNEY